MDEKVNKEVGPEKDVESEPLDLDELEKNRGGYGCVALLRAGWHDFTAKVTAWGAYNKSCWRRRKFSNSNSQDRIEQVPVS